MGGSKLIKLFKERMWLKQWQQNYDNASRGGHLLYSIQANNQSFKYSHLHHVCTYAQIFSVDHLQNAQFSGLHTLFSNHYLGC